MEWSSNYYLFKILTYEELSFLFGPQGIENKIPYGDLKLYRFNGENVTFHYLVIDDNSQEIEAKSGNLYFGDDDKLYDFLKSRKVETEEYKIESYELSNKKNILVKLSNGYLLTIKKTYKSGGCHTTLFDSSSKKIFDYSSYTVEDLKEISSIISKIEWHGDNHDDPVLTLHNEKIKKQKKGENLGCIVFFLFALIIALGIYFALK